MPLLRLTLTDLPGRAEAQAELPQQLTGLMRDILNKRADLTVVQTEVKPAFSWTSNGRRLQRSDWCASLEVFITDGTNTVDEIAAFIGAANKLICGEWSQSPAAPLYIVVHTVGADKWGFDGKTQGARRTSSN